MFEIKGKMNTAVCYATVVEEIAIEQIRRMCDYEFTKGSRIRIMPDVHAGKGCTIGTTMTIVDKAVPNIVGVDIGCGMYTVALGAVDIDFEKLDEAAHYIPSGMHIWEGRQERFDLQELRCYRSLKNTKWLERSIGTLGGGNHFIEVDEASDGRKYLVIHSGSRNLGKQVAELYQQLAIDLNKGKETYFQQRDEIIRTYKEQGRRKEIQAALEKISWNKRETTIPEDLCFLYQVERYGGIFRESKILPKLDNVDNRYLLGTKALGSYLHRYSNGELESFPVFSLENPERICAGGQTMVRYPICGFMEDGEIRQDKHNIV